MSRCGSDTDLPVASLIGPLSPGADICSESPQGATSVAHCAIPVRKPRDATKVGAAQCATLIAPYGHVRCGSQANDFRHGVSLLRLRAVATASTVRPSSVSVSATTTP